MLTCTLTGRSPAPPAVACSLSRVYPCRGGSSVPDSSSIREARWECARSKWVEHASRELSQGPQDEGGLHGGVTEVKPSHRLH